MSNCIFEFTKDQWDLSILYCAELFSAKPGIVVNVKNITMWSQLDIMKRHNVRRTLIIEMYGHTSPIKFK